MEEHEVLTNANAMDIFPLDDTSVPGERSPPHAPLNARMNAALQLQHQELQRSIMSWARQQEELLAALFKDQEHPTALEGIHGSCASVASAAVDRNAVVQEPPPCKRVQLQRTIADYEGLWIDRLGWFNGGAPVHLSDASVDEEVLTPTYLNLDLGTQTIPEEGHLSADGHFIVRKTDSEWVLCSSGIAKKSRLQFAVDLDPDNKLIVRSVPSGSQCILERSCPTEIFDSESRSRMTSMSLSNRSATTETIETEGSYNMLRNYVTNKLNPFSPTPTQGEPVSHKARRNCHKLCDLLDRPPKTRTGILADLVHSKQFEMLSSLIIMANAVTVGLSSNYAIENLEQPDNETLEALEVVWSIFYFIELVLRIVVHRCDYFLSSEWKWNAFDLVLVIMAINDQIIGMLMQNEDGPNMSVVRILRMAKMLKLLRMVRLMRMFRQLRLILNSILGSVHSMLWSLVLVGIICSCLGICFVQAATQHLLQEEVSEELRSDIIEWWGSVPKAMLSMYMSSFGGEDWRKIAHPLWLIGSGVFYVIFLFYIGFFHCVIANTLTSLFVEATMTNADTDHQQIILAELDNKEKYIKMLRQWFTTIDTEGTGQVSMSQFTEGMHSQEMFAFASRMGIEITDIRQFFAVLTSNGTRPVDLETFVVGCIKLKGAAKSMDLMDLMHAHRQLLVQELEFERYCEGEFKAIRHWLTANGHLRVSNGSPCSTRTTADCS